MRWWSHCSHGFWAELHVSRELVAALVAVRSRAHSTSIGMFGFLVRDCNSLGEREDSRASSRVLVSSDHLVFRPGRAGAAAAAALSAN